MVSTASYAARPHRHEGTTSAGTRSFSCTGLTQGTITCRRAGRSTVGGHPAGGLAVRSWWLPVEMSTTGHARRRQGGLRRPRVSLLPPCW